VQPIFEHLQQLGNVEQDEMLRTFNMGLGMLLVVPAQSLRRANGAGEGRREGSYGRTYCEGDESVVQLTVIHHGGTETQRKSCFLLLLTTGTLQFSPSLLRRLFRS